MIVVLALWVTIPLLALTTFVQVLYLESLRLRTRDLPSLKFFKETLEDRIGLKTEDGAGVQGEFAPLLAAQRDQTGVVGAWADFAEQDTFVFGARLAAYK